VLLFSNIEKRFYVLKLAKGDVSLSNEGKVMSGHNIPFCSKAYRYSEKEEVDSWILMDYIPGITLSDIIEKSIDNEEIKPVAFFKIVALLCNTVKKLHDLNIIHRDIKPDNIVIDGDFNAHLIDLGDVGDVDPTTGKRATGILHGTIPFVAPEVFINRPSLKSDIFSIGATIFQMVTKQYPFDDLYTSIEGVDRCREIVENDREFEPDLDEIMDTFENLKEIMEIFVESNDSYIFHKNICPNVKNIIQRLVLKGHVDTRFKEGTEMYNRLSPRNQELMNLAYKCMQLKEEDRPTCDEVIFELMDIGERNLLSQYSEVEEYIAALDDVKCETYGTIENVKKAVDRGFDAVSETLRKAADACIDGYSQSSEQDFSESYKILTEKY
jgi:serine/threonine protein kinase